MTLPEIRGESLVLFLDRKGIAFSSGSACKSGNPDPSHALLAMGLTPQEAHCSVRFSLGASMRKKRLIICWIPAGAARRDPQHRPLRAVPLTDAVYHRRIPALLDNQPAFVTVYTGHDC